MLSLNNLGVICISQALQHSPKLLAIRQCLSKASSRATLCNNSITFSSKGTRRHTGFRLLNESIVKHVSSLQRTFCTASAKLHCWNCGQSVEQTPAFFCLSCNFVQPPDERASYFLIMECDQTFALDTQRLQKTYLKLQRSLHPDNFSQKTVKEQEYSEYQSALVNKAYRTLLKPLSRGLYMLELNGMGIEEGTDAGADPLFLMELMEINQALDEARSKEESAMIGASMKEKLKDLTEQIDASLHKGELQAAKALLAQMKYFANIEEKVKEKLSELM
uniref:Iron-sulfur cluster co-chaperone protein HscB n=1 Tax=Salmo salar TaxID=8030 RepID=B5X7I7_SALSA|nr:Co-chaperone protein HscB, mitochondrial precursor [Salmo salar]